MVLFMTVSSVNHMPEMCFYFANSVCVHLKALLGQNYFVDVHRWSVLLKFISNRNEKGNSVKMWL